MAKEKTPKKVARKKKYKMVPQGNEEVKKNVKKARRAPTLRAINVQRTELVEFLMANEDRPTREVVTEFRELCPHNFIEIAHLVKENRRTTYQTCRRCGLFATNRKAVM
jgi:hypothetical protein